MTELQRCWANHISMKHSELDDITELFGIGGELLVDDAEVDEVSLGLGFAAVLP